VTKEEEWRQRHWDETYARLRAGLHRNNDKLMSWYVTTVPGARNIASLWSDYEQNGTDELGKDWSARKAAWLEVALRIPVCAHPQSAFVTTLGPPGFIRLITPMEETLYHLAGKV